MTQKIRSTGLFYLRDSGGKHEMTPEQYVQWAQRRAKELDVDFDGTPEAIDAMIKNGDFARAPLFLDWGVKGNTLSRRGLDAMMREVLSDNNRYKYVFIPRRDRLSRPDDPIDGVNIENALRRAGLWVVYLDRILSPLSKGGRQDIAELITALIDYDRAGKDRRDLAQKILFAQLHLAKKGFSTGGRAPFGFRRWLVKVDGTRERELKDREIIKMPGHHVVWLPGPDAEIELIRRILRMLETMPAARVAATLTAEEIPSPDAGRYRTDNGIRHAVLGVWHATTIMNIARNPLLLAMVVYGRRSMGDQMRYTANGPREITEQDFRPDNKNKVIQNPVDDQTIAPAHGTAVVEDIERHQQLLARLDARGTSQRGKPRSRDPNNNPLGARIFDLNCAGPMYRLPYNKSFRYLCGLYQKSHGEICDSNHVEGPIVTRFMLTCIKQRVRPTVQREKLSEKLRAIAARELSNKVTNQSAGSQSASSLTTAIAKVDQEVETVKHNMALAQNPAQFEAMAAVFENLVKQQSKLRSQARESELASKKLDVESELTNALKLFDRLEELATANGGLAAAGELFRLVNARVFLRFRKTHLKKRVVNHVAGGIAVFGATPAPIAVYQGPTGRQYLKGCDEGHPGRRRSLPGQSVTEREGKSIGNRNRGDWI